MSKFKPGDRVVFRPDRHPAPFGYSAPDGAMATVTGTPDGAFEMLYGRPLVFVEWDKGDHSQMNGEYFEDSFDLES